MEYGGGKLPEKLTRTILQYPNLILKLHVKLKNENGIFHSEYSYGNNKYISINANGFLTLELPKDKDNNEYDPTKSFIIGTGNIGNVVTRMKKVLKNIYNEDIFAIKDNKVIIYNDMAKQYTEQITIPRLGQGLLIRPSVVYDENETTYEGVTIYVNNSNNAISLSIDEYENLIYILEKIDIVNISQLLLNYYMIHVMNAEKLKEVASGRVINQQIKSIDWGSSKPKTISNYRKEESNDIFEGL